MDQEGLELEIIINPKAMSDGQAVIQVPIYLDIGLKCR